MGNKAIAPPRQKVDLIWQKPATIVYKDDNRVKPMVHIVDFVFEVLCAPWEDALVAKLLGKCIGYNVMKDRLTCLWRLIVGFDILDIDNNFYMVKFDMEMDITKVMKEGILLALAAAIGTPIRVDSTMLDVRRGSVCVKIDLDKPVIEKVWLEGFSSISVFCSECCSGGGGTNGDAKGKQVVVASMRQDAGSTSSNIPIGNFNTNNGNINGEDKSITANDELQGDWLVVKRKSRNKPNNQDKDGGTKNQCQSRVNDKDKNNILIRSKTNKRRVTTFRTTVT
ncbi:hypothetical protein JHK87_042613 [Glycine soja]|nr:hypothetical protein JHK87_042613 [Glycine soja]